MKYFFLLLLILPLRLVAQTLTVEDGGSLTGEFGSQINADITNNGTVEISEFSLAGDYVQSSTGTYKSEIFSGAVASSVSIDGNVTLGGELVIEEGATSLPPAENIYTLMTYTGSLSGTFSTVSKPAAYDDYIVDYGQYRSGEVILIRESLLPVKLVSFSAAQNNEVVDLDWVTASEQNNQGFNVQHSTDGISFFNIGCVDGQGNSSIETIYDFVHDSPVLGLNYYRLQQVDFDEQSDYSSIEVVDFTSDYQDLEFVVYPNPVMNEFKIQTSEIFTNAVVSIFDTRGALRKTMNIQSGQSVDISEMEAGVYFIQFTVEGKQPIVSTIVKQ